MQMMSGNPKDKDPSAGVQYSNKMTSFMYTWMQKAFNKVPTTVLGALRGTH
jgi:hypothetical protein